MVGVTKDEWARLKKWQAEARACGKRKAVEGKRAHPMCSVSGNRCTMAKCPELKDPKGPVQVKVAKPAAGAEKPKGRKKAAKKAAE